MAGRQIQKTLGRCSAAYCLRFKNAVALSRECRGRERGGTVEEIKREKDGKRA
jgi:hypothetical protein